MACSSTRMGIRGRSLTTPSGGSAPTAVSRSRGRTPERRAPCGDLKRVVDARSALDELVADLEADGARPSIPGSFPLPETAWPWFAQRWSVLGPELTTYLYVAEFVPENVRRTARDRMANVERAARRSEARSTSVLDAIKGLSATLDQVRESVDAALGLPATHRPL